MTTFSIQTNDSHGVPVLHIHGEIDLHTCPELSKALDLAITNHPNIVLNLDHVRYIDSTGLGVIAYTARKLSETNGAIHIVCTQAQIKKIIELSGLHKKNVVIYDNEQSALKGFQS